MRLEAGLRLALALALALVLALAFTLTLALALTHPPSIALDILSLLATALALTLTLALPLTQAYVLLRRGGRRSPGGAGRRRGCLARGRDAASVGLGRIVALYYRSSTLHQIH